ncbi:MAG: hypothetical protein IAF38_05640 [Bacteroidia bacterium]|nr:hypothetical protein [Bacteroidia bacterium]
MKKMKIALFFVALGGLGYFTFNKLNGKKEKEVKVQLDKIYSPGKYDTLKTSVAELKKKTSVAASKDAFTGFMYKKMFPFWYDTEWDFNGITQVPRQGKIACGYFVTTVLRDAGVKLERVKLACCASEQMIKTLTTEDHIKRYSNFKNEKFCNDVKKHGKGVFVIGLDSHTGFIVNTGDSLFFIHSNGYGWSDKKVIKEIAVNSPVLEHSAYKVVGYLTEDTEFLKSWKNGE